jgi:phosphoglucosamine mutase
MAKHLFGTDGIRGVAGEYPLDDTTVYAVGLALAQHITARRDRDPTPPAVVVGMDTRESSRPLAELLAGGLEAGGVGVRFVDVLPTAGVAFLTEGGDFAAGVMISASHNAFQDNGIKVFGSSGFKMPDAEEHELETGILRLLEQKPAPRRKPLEPEATLAERYFRHVLGIVKPSGALSRFRVVVDCANGAAYRFGPRLLASLNVSAEVIGNEPDGRNINLGCGSLYLDKLQQRVLASKADLGIAFDGDADRALFVADDGSIVDGDVVLLLAADYLDQRGHLPGKLVVGTVMANMGLEKALADAGIELVRTPVGDKYVLEEMNRRGAALGGEQSGHVIFREYATTGDGLVTGRMLLEVLAVSQKPLSELRRRLTVFPQRLENIRVKQKTPFEQVPVLAEAVRGAERELGDRGRVLVRYSGTEPLVRIMVEAQDPADVERHTGRLAQVFRAYLGA